MIEQLGPYKINSITIGDSFEMTEELPPESVDLLVTDPPYFLPVQSYVGTRESGYVKRTLADTAIMQTYFNLVFEKFARVVKNTGTAYVFCDGQSYPIFYRAMYPHFKYVRPLIWDKVNSRNGYTWRHRHEIIAWGEGYEAERIPTGEGDVLQCRGVKQADRLHPAEKPVKLLCDLISKHGEGNIVLDPYCGSASTGEAAKVTGNHFIGFEHDAEYLKVALKRMERAKLPLLETVQAQLWGNITTRETDQAMPGGNAGDLSKLEDLQEQSQV